MKPIRRFFPAPIFLFLYLAFSLFPAPAPAEGFGSGSGSSWKAGTASPDSIFSHLADSVFADCLSRLLLKPSELSFDRCWARDDTFRLDIAAQALTDPLTLPAIRDHLTASAPDSGGALSGFLPTAWDCLGITARPAGQSRPIQEALASDGGTPGAATVTAMCGILEEVSALLDAAFSNLTLEEKIRLLACAPVFFANEEEADTTSG